ncbi:MAG: hypothetical protein AABY83_01145 [Pseudomonadota bacterium]
MADETPKFNFNQLLTRANRLSLRETLMMSATAATLVCGLAYVLWLSPMEKQQLSIDTELKEKQRALGETQELLKKPANIKDPNLTKRGQLEFGLDRLRKIEDTLTQSTQRLTQATDANQLVENALANYPRIHLERFANMPPDLVLRNEDSQSKNLSEAVRALFPDREFILYRHLMIAEVRGPYHDLVAYLQRLEQTSQKLFIGEVKLKTLDYPDSILSVELITLSPHRTLFRAQATTQN